MRKACALFIFSCLFVAPCLAGQKRYHIPPNHRPLACVTHNPCFKIFFKDSHYQEYRFLKVKLIRIDSVGMYFLKKDIIK